LKPFGNRRLANADALCGLGEGAFFVQGNDQFQIAYLQLCCTVSNRSIRGSSFSPNIKNLADVHSSVNINVEKLRVFIGRLARYYLT
jgi:hypothetical protein